MNQPPGDGSIPDAEISARFTWQFETKTTRGVTTKSAAHDQVRRHAEQLSGMLGAVLFVLTPDPVRPAWFGLLDGFAEDVTVLWAGFRDLSDAIRGVIADPSECSPSRRASCSASSTRSTNRTVC